MEINIRMESKNLFEFTLLLLFIGILNLGFNYFFCKNMHTLSILIGFLPFIIIMIRNHIAQQKAVSNYSVVTPFIIGIFIAIIFANIALTKVYDRVGVNMDLDSYEKYLELDKYGENKYIDHFPEKIPDFADKAEIREWTGIVPRELGFYLYYKIDENNIPNLELDSYKEKSKEVINTVSKLEDVRQVVVIPDRVIESLKIEDGKDFTIFLLDGSPITEVTSGYSYGVGINYTDKRVLFFTERW